MKDRKRTTVRLSPEAERLLPLIADKIGISQNAVIEIAIREKAERLKIK